MSAKFLSRAFVAVAPYLSFVCVILAILVLRQLDGRLDDKRNEKKEAEEVREKAERDKEREALLAAPDAVKAAKTPEELKALFAGFDPKTTSHVLGSDELRDAFLKWFSDDPALALSMSEALPQKRRYFAFRWGEAFYHRDPGLFLSAARRYLEVAYEQEVSVAIFTDLGETDAEKGLALLPDVKSDYVRKAVLPAFFRAWAKHDAEKARESAGRMEDARDRRLAGEAAGEGK